MVDKLVIEAAIRAVTEGMPSTIARRLDEVNPIIPLRTPQRIQDHLRNRQDD